MMMLLQSVVSVSDARPRVARVVNICTERQGCDGAGGASSSSKAKSSE